MAYLPAAADKLLGIYLLAVVSLKMFTPSWPMQVVMMVVGAVTILAAVLMAMMQHNLKRLLSFHAVSQVGYMVLGIGTGTTIGVIGGLFHMVNNAIYKSCLFLMSGTAARAAGSDEIKDMGGLARCLPVTFITGAVAAAAISGVPPFNGFVSKWMVYQGTLEVGQPATGAPGLAIALVVTAVFGSALTLDSFVKVIYSAFLSPAPKARAGARPRESFFLAAPMVVLAAACVFLGLFPNTLINEALLPAVSGAETTGEAVSATVGQVSTGAMGLWRPSQATGLIVVGVLLGLAFVWVSTRSARVRVVRPFLAGEVPSAADDRFRIPGTHFYETVGKLPIVGPLLLHGEGGALDPYHWSERHGSTFVRMLRRWHTGLLSLYAAWCLLGLTVTLIYLLLTAGTF
jgi:formate hydrogenlyase subunit 3/multisubunit Na+/H+ antiporter MnhD subunit